MQRGRGRGRGRNSNPARGDSRRGVASHSRRTTASQSRASSLRRSARLAQLTDDQLPNGNHPLPEINGSMADVARPRALSNRNARSRQHSSRTPGRSRGSRHSASPEDFGYAMDIILQPPSTARADIIFGRSVIVRLRATNGHPDDTDLGRLYALATLVPEPNSTGPRDPAVLGDILRGNYCKTIQSFAEDAADGFISSMEMDVPGGVGYLQFDNLRIRQAGSYRLRITLIRVRDVSSDPVGGGESLQVVVTNPIVVQGGRPSTGLAPHNGEGDDENDGGWLDVLRTLRTRQRSPGR